MPLKPVLNSSCIGGLDGEYAEMSSRYKASHIKLMLWWVARKTHEVSESHPHESWFDMFLVIMGFLFGVVFGPCLQTSCIKLFSSYATIISMNLFVLCGKLCSGCCVASIGSLYLWYSKDGGNHV